MNEENSDADVASSRPAMNKKRLGRGLGALLGETRREEPLVRYPAQDSDQTTENTTESTSTGLRTLSVASIEPLPGQPRTHFDESALAELAESIAARGVIQPIIVRPRGAGRYQIVAGERRWRAAQKARLHEIPAIIRELEDREVMALALIENIQREDLNPIEEARAYQRLADDEDMTQADIAAMVDKSRSHVANLMRLLTLPPQVVDFVSSGELSMGHARALIGHERALELAKRAIAGKLSVREVEKLAREGDVPATKTSAVRTPRDPAKDADIIAVQGHLEEFLGMKVRIKTDSDPRSGEVTIRYRTLDQLDLICQRLTGGDI